MDLHVMRGHSGPVSMYCIDGSRSEAYSGISERQKQEKVGTYEQGLIGGFTK